MKHKLIFKKQRKMSSFGIYGIIELILSIIFLLIQAVTLPHFIIDKEYRKFISYRLMFLIGICETYLIIGTEYWNTWTLLTGAIYEAAFDTLFIMNLALALNRLFAMQVNMSESKFELFIYKCLFVFFALIFASIAALFMSPYCGLYIDENLIAFVMTKTQVFLCIFTILKKSMEMRILIQSFVQYCLFLAPLIIGTLGCPPNWSLIDYYGIITTIEILFFGLNPIIYFISLSSFRSKVINGLCFWKKSKTTSYVLPKIIQVKPSNIAGGLSIRI
ncbi:7TM_GPCR_Srx domain-containing protein [Meloidogyne graminicola]|uniref:7TM_GPCR_Srx domain-containing protein n=1 Tax=Meloidogyne graminicola TaxID=189291 RepID=A0A8S9ZG11_9BILA|nr:7TM_GPCR_Srx domain-containing protein [Meloidogyne graminicola]